MTPRDVLVSPDSRASPSRPITTKDISDMNQTYGTMFARGERFKSNVEMACRGGVGVALVIWVTTVPGLINDTMPRAYNDVQLLCMVGFWFVLTFWKDLGTTVRNAVQAILGTLVAVLNSLVLNAIFPGGAKNARSNGYAPSIAWADIFVVAFLLIFMNVSDRFRTFGLFYLAMFMMHFMNPESTAIFSRNFEINWNGTGISYLLVCTSGCVLAILFTLLPYPRLVSQSVVAECNVTAATVCVVIEQVTEIYLGSSATSALHSKCEKAADGIAEKLKELESRTELMWWEGFDIGRLGSRRHLLVRFVALLKKLMDIVHGLEHAARVEEPVEGGLLKELTPEIQQLIASMSATLVGSGGIVDFMSDGDLANHQVDTLLRRAEQLRREVHAISRHYTGLRVEGGHPTLSIFLLEEDYFVYNMSALAHAVREFAMTVQKPAERDLQKEMESTLLDLVDPTATRGNLNFVFRAYVAYMVAFFAGVYLFGYDFLLPATIALVLSKFTGSALERNLGRMQGVVLGLVLPVIVLTQLPTCGGGAGTWAFLLLIFLFIGLCLYIYFSATDRYAFIGMLTAAFAAQSFFQPCDGDGRIVGASLHFFRVVVTITAIFLIAVIDLSLTSERPSEAFQFHTAESLRLAKKALTRFYDGREMGKLLVSTVALEVERAQDMAVQASHEPRFWRTPFPSRMVQPVLSEIEDLCADLRILHRASHVYKSEHAGHPDIDALLRPVRKEPVWKECVSDMLTQFDAVSTLLARVLAHESSSANEHLLNYQHNMQANDRIEDLVDAITPLLKYAPELDVLDDPRARIGVAIFIINSVHNRLDFVVEAVMRY